MINRSCQAAVASYANGRRRGSVGQCLNSGLVRPCAKRRQLWSLETGAL